MEEHEFLIVEWINHLVGAPEGEHIIPMQVIMATFVLLGCLAFFAFVRSRLSVENPGHLQQAMELVVDFLATQLDELVGHGGRRFVNLVGTLAIFILLSNLLGLVPGFGAPTSNFNVPAGCAIIVFLYYNFQGMRKHGVLGYLKHFAGPVWWLAPLMIPIELISHVARPLTLTMRLFANIFAEETVVLVFFGLFAVLLPLSPKSIDGRPV
jgi:F-type H+-transporting ATPase subunit a